MKLALIINPARGGMWKFGAFVSIRETTWRLCWKYFLDFELHTCRIVTLESAREDYGVVVPARSAR